MLFDPIEKERSFANFPALELEINKHGPTKWNTLQIVDRTDHRFEIKVTRCMYHELAVSVGVPEVTPVVCQIDNAAFNSYAPDTMLFHRGGPKRRIADGQSECNFIWESTPVMVQSG